MSSTILRPTTLQERKDSRKELSTRRPAAAEMIQLFRSERRRKRIRSRKEEL